MEDIPRQGEVINMEDPCLANGPVQDPQLPRGGVSFRPADMSYATTVFERRRSENIAEAVDVH